MALDVLLTGAAAGCFAGATMALYVNWRRRRDRGHLDRMLAALESLPDSSERSLRTAEAFYSLARSDVHHWTKAVRVSEGFWQLRIAAAFLLERATFLGKDPALRDQVELEIKVLHRELAKEEKRMRREARRDDGGEEEVGPESP
jgi:hypothetical protein